MRAVLPAQPLTRERTLLVRPAGSAGMAIKPKYIKQLANVLLEEYPDSFNADFETNKESVATLTTVESKGVRNRIAGYITAKKSQAAAAA